MSEKSSLPITFGAGTITASPKCPVNALVTFSVTSASLSVSGACSKYTKSGSRGQFDAWHSAVTMRRIASSSAVRTVSL